MLDRDQLLCLAYQIQQVESKRDGKINKNQNQVVLANNMFRKLKDFNIETIILQ